MARRKIYYKTLREAKSALKKLQEEHPYSFDGYEIHRQPKGTRHHGQYVVSTYLYWLHYAD